VLDVPGHRSTFESRATHELAVQMVGDIADLEHLGHNPNVAHVPHMRNDIRAIIGAA
jgi:hypothetical protein